jgi:DNA-binding PucR family transcriptional regulator
MLDLNENYQKNISLTGLVSALSDEQKTQLAQPYDLKKFAVIFEDNDMMSTCISLFENSLNVSLTARKMYMHRNTLIYRLNKIKKITGLDVCDFRQAITFIVLHILYSND